MEVKDRNGQNAAKKTLLLITCILLEIMPLGVQTVSFKFSLKISNIYKLQVEYGRIICLIFLALKSDACSGAGKPNPKPKPTPKPKSTTQKPGSGDSGNDDYGDYYQKFVLLLFSL